LHSFAISNYDAVSPAELSEREIAEREPAMTESQRTGSFIPRDITALAILACQITGVLALQGTVVLAFYALAGPPADPSRLPPGLRLDPLHAVVHLAIGLIGGYVGFYRPSSAFHFLRAFAVVYIALAIFGSFTSIHFGMQLGLDENLFHWTVGTIVGLIGFRLLPESLFRSARA
jgi:hypothetical protein